VRELFEKVFVEHEDDLGLLTFRPDVGRHFGNADL
jgi:hypothetical protein